MKSKLDEEATFKKEIRRVLFGAFECDCVGATVAYDVTHVDVFCAIMTFLYWMFLLMTKVYPNPVTLRSSFL